MPGSEWEPLTGSNRESNFRIDAQGAGTSLFWKSWSPEFVSQMTISQWLFRVAG